MRASEMAWLESEDEEDNDDFDDDDEEDYDDVNDDCDDEDNDGDGDEIDDDDDHSELGTDAIEQILDEWSDSATEPENNQVVLLEEGLWGKLSEELVCRILAWLPSRAQARFCSVCWRWNELLSSFSPSIELEHCGRGIPRPSCMIIWSYDPDPLIFCHADHKWFGVPSDVSDDVDLSWKLEDADAGLLCYNSIQEEKMWIRVCNPMTHSFQVLPSDYLLSDSQMGHLLFVTLKLVVDREAKKFKVILLPDNTQVPLTTVVVFDSRTNSWTDFHRVPSQCYEMQSFFVRKNVIYFRTSHPNPNIFETVDLHSGNWSQIEIEKPCDVTKRLSFISNRDRVMLVDMNPSGEEPIRVWRHLDNISENCVPIFTAPRWEKVVIEPHPLLRKLVGEFEYWLTDGSEYICFSFAAKTNRWLKYTFATRRWDVMPRGGAKDEEYDLWYIWEPGLDMVLTSRGAYDYSDHPELDLRHRYFSEMVRQGEEELKRLNQEDI